MSACDNQPETTSLLHNDKFRMLIHRLPKVTYFIQSAQIAGMTNVEAEFNTRFANAYQAGDTMLYDELTVEFLVDENLENWSEIYDWMKLIGMPEVPLPQELEYQDLLSDLTLQLYTNNNKLNKNIIYKSAFPTNLGTIELNSAVTEATEIIVPLTFRYTSFEVVDNFSC